MISTEEHYELRLSWSCLITVTLLGLKFIFKYAANKYSQNSISCYKMRKIFSKNNLLNVEMHKSLFRENKLR